MCELRSTEMFTSQITFDSIFRNTKVWNQFMHCLHLKHTSFITEYIAIICKKRG